jgi:hypothetical protein
LAEALGAFVAWTAARYEPLQQRLRGRAEELRNQGRGRAIHARLAAAGGQLQAGFEIFLDFALEIGAIDPVTREALTRRTERAVSAAIARQAKYHQAADPAQRFLTLLAAALSHGRAHIADRRGQTPEAPQNWGWRRKGSRERWIPQGVRIGWLEGGDLYLEPRLSYGVAQLMAENEGLSVSERMLRHRLKQAQCLVSIDESRQMLSVRRMLEGCSRQVLHLRANLVHSSTPTGIEG